MNNTNGVGRSMRVAKLVRTWQFIATSVAILTTIVLASPAAAGISGATGQIQVFHYTGDPLTGTNFNFDRVPPDGSEIHLNDNTELTAWFPWPDTFSLDSASDIHRPMTNLVIGSTSVTGDFVYHFTPGDTNYFVGWPEQLRLTQFNNPALNEVDKPSVLRIDFSVDFALDEAGIPFGGVPLGINFRASGNASFARYDYLVKLDSSIFDENAPAQMISGGREFEGGNFNFNEMQPAGDDMMIFAPQGLAGGMGQSLVVSGYFLMQVKNDDFPAEFVMQSLTPVPEPTTVLLFVMGLLSATLRCQRDR